LLIAIICIVEIPPLVKNKQRKELITVISLLAVALALKVGKTLDIITPISLLHDLLSPLGKMLLK
jgi:hypothetical protein